MMEQIVKVQNLSKSYKKIKAVDGISFDISKGQIFSLVGPNGAGKSTTLRILATILSADSGKVEIFGYDLFKDPESIRKLISYLPEEAGAYKNMSGLAYLKFMATFYSDDPKAKTEIVERGVEMANLANRINDPIKHYSKGMTRKLLLARALMTQPKLAILDEPTSGLDVINSRFIRDTIKENCKRGMSVLLSSHNMLEIEYLSDEVSIINRGKIAANGSSQELLSKYNKKNLEDVFMEINRTEK